MTDKEIEEIKSKDFRQQSIILWALALASMLILNTLILINVNDLKDRNDDLSAQLKEHEENDYGRYKDLMFLEQQDYRRLTDHLNGVENRLIRWIDNTNKTILKEIQGYGNMNNLILHDIRDSVERGFIYRYPDDYAEIENYVQNVSIQVGYYNNSVDSYGLMPTFAIENWTHLIDWMVATYEYDRNTLTQMQMLQLTIIAMDLAYYKETGTWLGE